MKPFSLLKSSSRVAALSCAAILSLSSTDRASGQTGEQDPTFAVGSDANGRVYALAVQGDDEVIVGGAFTTFDGQGRNCLARLHTDGSLDAFNPGLAISGYNGAAPSVRAVAVQADGKILAAGSFTVLNQPGGGGVVRLNADGSLDTSFNVVAGVVDDGGTVGTAYALAVLPGGKILVGGAFQKFNGVSTAGLVRLNANGTVDTTFNPGGAGVAANSYGQDVRSIFVQTDGRIVIGGYFSSYDGNAAGGVARLSATGAFDSNFEVGTGASDGGVLAVSVQSNGQVLAGGGYNTFDGASVQHLVRLNIDGSLDTSYSPDGDLFISEVDALLVQPDGTALAGGDFLSQGGLVNQPHNGLLLLNSDGTQNGAFDSGSTSRQVMAVALESDGKAFVASNTDALSGAPTGNVFRHIDIALPLFFTGQVSLGNGVYYLSFSNGNYFGYYSYLSDPHYFYHFDLGYEYVFDANDGHAGVYFYDFKSNGFFYTSPGFPFPYLYDFSLNSVVYYYPDPSNPGHYNTNGYRFFYVFNTGKIIVK